MKYLRFGYAHCCRVSNLLNRALTTYRNSELLSLRVYHLRAMLYLSLIYDMILIAVRGMLVWRVETM